MAKLDNAVADHLEDRPLDPRRLSVLVGELLDRREDYVERRRGHITEPRKRAAEATPTSAGSTKPS